MSIPIPSKLYKYVTFDRLDVLKNECIRFTQAAALNDPRELKPYLEDLMDESEFEREMTNPLVDDLNEEGMVQKAIEMWREMPAAQRSRIPGGLPAYKKKARRYFRDNPDLVAQALAESQAEARQVFDNVNPISAQIFIKTMTESFGVLSLTTKSDNDPMWAHYADNHKGMVLEFDTGHQFFNRELKQGEIARPKPVLYKEPLPVYKNLQELLKLGNSEALSALMFTKREQWDYESEWRLVRHLSGADKKFGTNPDAVHLFNLPAAAISRIIVGTQMPNDHRQELRDFLSGEDRYRHIELWQSKTQHHPNDISAERLN